VTGANFIPEGVQALCDQYHRLGDRRDVSLSGRSVTRYPIQRLMRRGDPLAELSGLQRHRSRLGTNGKCDGLAKLLRRTDKGTPVTPRTS